MPKPLVLKRAPGAKLFENWPVWTGDADTYLTHHLTLKNIIFNEELQENLGNNRHVCNAVYLGIPETKRIRVTSWIQDRIENPSLEWSIEEWLNVLESAFLPRDIQERASRRLYTIRQGHSQPLADFRAVFESLCSQARTLAPTGPNKIHTVTEAFAPYLRKALATQLEISRTDYEEFIAKAQALANNLEALPDFHNLKGNRKEWYITDKTNPNPNAQNHGPNPTQNTSPGPIAGSVDAEGNTYMGGTQGVVGNLEARLAVLERQTNEKPRRLQGGRDQKTSYIHDTRPRAPPITAAEFQNRESAQRCIRCGKAPSHRFGDCKYKSFAQHPLAISNIHRYKDENDSATPESLKG